MNTAMTARAEYAEEENVYKPVEVPAISNGNYIKQHKYVCIY